MPKIELAARIRERLSHNNWGLMGSQGYVLGIDPGGYGLRAALVNLHDHTYTSAAIETSAAEPQDILTRTLEVARTLLDESGVPASRLLRVGVGFGGPIDPQTGRVLFTPRKPEWEHFALRDAVEQALDTSTLADNDANLIALAEATFGTGSHLQHLVYLHLSSGVGGGLVFDRHLYKGAHGLAGEIGHASIGPGLSGRTHTATLEELVSISGLLQRAREQGLDTTNLNDIFSDHPVGQHVVDEAVQILGLRLAHIVALLNPDIIVLGGIVVRIGGDRFVAAIASAIHTHLPASLAHSVQVVASVLGPDSIAIGGIALALESLLE